MNPRILTALEREKIKAYLKANGNKDLHVRQIVYLARRHLPAITEDVGLLKRLVSRYKREA